MQLKSMQKTRQRTRVVPIRVTEREYIAISENAVLYAKGSVSAWLRYTGMNYTPSDAELAMTNDENVNSEEDDD